MNALKYIYVNWCTILSAFILISDRESECILSRIIKFRIIITILILMMFISKRYFLVILELDFRASLSFPLNEKYVCIYLVFFFFPPLICFFIRERIDMLPRAQNLPLSIQPSSFPGIQFSSKNI